MSDKNLISTRAAAAQIGVAPITLRKWRSAGTGPAYVKVSANRVCYYPAEVRAFIKARKRGGKNAR